MALYRKKPVVIEAFQITEETRNDNKDWPNWLNQAWNKDRKEEGAVYPFSLICSAIAFFKLLL